MRNIKTKKNWKAVALLLALLLPMGVFAQGGLFQRGPIRESDQAISITNQHFGHFVDGDDVTNQPFGHFVDGDNITNQTFGTPLGSGLLIMLAASVCYVKTKNKKNESSKHNLK
jgi:hypothetical protein